MLFDEFENGCNRLVKWFKKPLDDYQVEQVFKAVKFMPFIAWNDMVGKIIESSKPVASNFPTIADIRTHWYQWRKEHPHMTVSHYQKTTCDECDRIGILFFTIRKEGEFPYGHVAKCAKCENWRQHWGDNVPVVSLTRDEILAKGWEMRFEVNNPHPQRQVPIENLAKDMFQ